VVLAAALETLAADVVGVLTATADAPSGYKDLETHFTTASTLAERLPFNRLCFLNRDKMTPINWLVIQVSVSTVDLT